MSKLTDFGKAIRKLRIDYDTNLNELATSIGVSSAFLSAVETGKKPISAELITKITNALGLSKQRKICLHMLLVKVLIMLLFEQIAQKKQKLL